MNVMLNKDNVVIDIVETVKPVMKNRNNITVLCKNEEAQGYVGSDNDTIFAKVGQQFQPSFYDIAKLYVVYAIPKGVGRLTHKYVEKDGNMVFVRNEDSFPDTNEQLTKKVNELENIILDMSDIIYG